MGELDRVKTGAEDQCVTLLAKALPWKRFCWFGLCLLAQIILLKQRMLPPPRSSEGLATPLNILKRMLVRRQSEVASWENVVRV